MKPHFVCNACEDKGTIDGRMCSCQKQVLKDLMRKEVSRFAPLDKCTFDKFELSYYSEQPMENAIVPRQRAEKILDTCRKYAQNFSLNSKSLFFFGGAGLGKTHLSLAIANVVINKGFSVCYGTSQNICDDLQSEQFGRTDNINYTKIRCLVATFWCLMIWARRLTISTALQQYTILLTPVCSPASRLLFQQTMPLTGLRKNTTSVSQADSQENTYRSILSVTTSEIYNIK